MVIYIYVFIIGLVVGSFLNVVISRVPEGKSIITPRSHCPNCLKNLTWIHLVPVFSFIKQKGKCASCGVKISVMYPLVELMTGLVFVVVFEMLKFNPLTLVLWVMAATFTVIVGLMINKIRVLGACDNER